MQLLEADAEGRAAAAASMPTGSSAARPAVRVDVDRVAELERRVEALEGTVARLVRELGLPEEPVGLPEEPAGSDGPE